MESKENLWAIVLAAGDGTRLRSLTRNDEGIAVPKQFCAFRGEKSMLRCALERAERLVPRHRIVVVVSPDHERWWKDDLAGYPPRNILIQPKNKGTAAGILYPLIEIMRRDYRAQIMVLPSDHYVEDEKALQKALEQAVSAAHWSFQRVVLLGFTPEEPDPEYGWIVPADSDNGVKKVARFVEKPPLALALQLMESQALLNSFIFVASEVVLFRLFMEKRHDLTHSFLTRLSDAAPKWDPEKLKAIYEHLPVFDFSRDLLEKAGENLAVLPVPSCGWSDLGTPKRVIQCLSKQNLVFALERPFRLPEERREDSAASNGI